MSQHFKNNRGNQQTAVQYNNKQYDRIRILGKGSFGTAIVHRRRADCSLVVLKEIDLHKFKGEQERAIAINEARIMSTLSHVNIIKYHNAYTTETKLIIEMEYASLGTLATYLTMHGSLLEEQEILVVFKQITSGLNYLHSKSIIHLDLKMTNIFVTIEGYVKIGDFGIAQYMYHNQSSSNQANNHNNNITPASQQAKNLQSSHLGTIAYSSPERCLDGLIDFKSDIWSLGCIMYELITSRPLFTGDSLPELVMNITRISYPPIKRKITPALRDLFEQMISRDPNRRPSAFDILCIIDQLYARAQLLNKQQTASRLNQKRQNYRFDLSTEVNMFAEMAQNAQSSVMNQINYPHSLVYQVRLDNQHIHVERVNLPQSKRIKEISKGKSHFLVLTYDNIVYGWGSKTHGQLGSCGLTQSNSAGSRPSGSGSGRTQLTRSARNSINSKDIQSKSRQLFTNSTTPTSLASSTQTIVQQQQQGSSTGNKGSTNTNSSSTRLNSKLITRQLVVSMLKESRPATRPFIINELNHRKIIQVAAGDNFSVFLSKTGIVMTCGDSSRGCLGRGQIDGACFTPCMVESLLNMDVVSIACGPKHVVAVCGNGKAFAWGKSSNGRLGIALQAGTSDSNLHTSGQLSKYILRPQQVQFPATSAARVAGGSGPDVVGSSGVFIQRVYCGDRCTIFIDSDNKCWACGENRFNKLGLDVKRRFKKTLIVNESWLPREITSLAKYNLVACDVSKNHSSFITSEGKLIVLGQDVDHGYRLESDLVVAINSRRKASQDPGKRDLETERFSQARNHKQLIESMMLHNQLTHFKLSQRPDDCSTGRSRWHPKFKLSKWQQRQVDLYMEKSRAMKKMSFECVVSVSCTSKFTLALTNDNRVYFWGTRTYKRDPNDDYMMLAQMHEGKDQRREARPATVETQVIPRNADDCFIKIGRTNYSLMSSIQRLGSDQPIIQAQDPRLVANSLADLWILDYRPMGGGRDDGCRSSSTTSSMIDSRDISEKSSWDGSCYSFTSCCETCCSCNEAYRSQFPRSEVDPCDSVFCCQNNSNDHEEMQPEEDTMRHDAILSPQPIVSLYIPSMFNHPGCSLRLVDLFCFDEDEFYLLLDTTIKQVHQSASQAASHGQPSHQQAKEHFSELSNQLTQPTTDNPNSTQNNHGNKMTPTLPPTPRLSPNSFQRREGHQLAGEDLVHSRGTDAGDQQSTRAETQLLPMKAPRAIAFFEVQQQVDLETVMEKELSFCCDNNNNNRHTVIPTATTTTNSRADRAAANSLSTSFNCGVSLEEPRSFSTFANAALGNHIIIGPPRHDSNSDDNDHDCQADEMQALSFSSSIAALPGGAITEAAKGDQMAGAQAISLAAQVRRNQRERRRQRTRLLSNRSESNSLFAGRIDCEETSSMPSWVKNEYLQYQQEDEEAEEHMQAISSTDDEQTFSGDRTASSSRTGSITPDGFRLSLSDLCRGLASLPSSTSAQSSVTSVDYSLQPTPRVPRPRVPHRISASHPDIRPESICGGDRVGVRGRQFELSLRELDGRQRRNSDTADAGELPEEPVVAPNLISCKVYKDSRRRSVGSSAASQLEESNLSSRITSQNPSLRAGSSPENGASHFLRTSSIVAFRSASAQVKRRAEGKSLSAKHKCDLALNNVQLSRSVQLPPRSSNSTTNCRQSSKGRRHLGPSSSVCSLRRSLARLFC